MKKYIIAANWKMNPATREEATTLAQGAEETARKIPNVDVFIAPPLVFLESVAGVLRKASLCAQDVFWEKKGPYTGEVSPGQLAAFGVRTIIVGHSERRVLGDTNEIVNRKIKNIIDAGMNAILCIGESSREDGEIPALVGEQIRSAFRDIKKNAVKKIMIAYEPVWAISTTQNATPDTPDSAFRANLFIRKTIADLYDRKIADNLCVLYGGSVRKENIFSFLADGKMQGALVGGASLDASEFGEIVRLASTVK